MNVERYRNICSEIKKLTTEKNQLTESLIHEHSQIMLSHAINGITTLVPNNKFLVPLFQSNLVYGPYYECELIEYKNVEKSTWVQYKWSKTCIFATFIDGSIESISILQDGCAEYTYANNSIKRKLKTFDIERLDSISEEELTSLIDPIYFPLLIVSYDPHEYAMSLSEFMEEVTGISDD